MLLYYLKENRITQGPQTSTDFYASWHHRCLFTKVCFHCHFVFTFASVYSGALFSSVCVLQGYCTYPPFFFKSKCINQCLAACLPSEVTNDVVISDAKELRHKGEMANWWVEKKKCWLQSVCSVGKILKYNCDKVPTASDFLSSPLEWPTHTSLPLSPLSIYSSLKCRSCGSAVGKVIHSAPPHLAMVRSIFLLNKANISW